MHRTDRLAAPLRPTVRWFAAVLLTCAAVLAGARVSAAAPATAPVPAPAPLPGHTVLCHPQDEGPGAAGGDRGCGAPGRTCLPATVPPLPPVLAVPVGAPVPPWLANPAGSGVSRATGADSVTPDLTVLCVSRT